MFSILVAKIRKEEEVTYSLRNPVKEIWVYESEKHIKSFNTKTEAFNYVQQYIPFTEYICIPGDINGLEFYWNLWGGEDEEVLQNTQEMSFKLHDINNYNFEYMKSEYDDLIQGTKEFEQIQNPPEHTEREVDGKLIIDGYVHETSRLIGDRYNFLMSSASKLDFNNLTLEEQKQCVVYDSKNMWVNEGYIFDLYCKRLSPKNYLIVAWYFYLSCNLSYFKYKARTKIENFIRSGVFKINTIRYKNGWY